MEEKTRESNCEMLNSPNSLPVISEPPGIRNWFSSYTNESFKIDTYGEAFRSSAFEGSDCDGDGFVVDKEKIIEKEADWGDFGRNCDGDDKHEDQDLSRVQEAETKYQEFSGVSTMFRHIFILLCSLSFLTSISTFSYGDMGENKVLIVGEELWEEKLPLQTGSCLYRLQGLKSYTWYEVKISYPASIPASFSIKLKHDSDLEINANRRLLNTEKLIFKTDSVTSDQKSKLHVLVTVEPEGYVAIPHVPEKQDITFNIVCDELLLGIPHKAWWVAILVLVCLGLAFIVPRFLPEYLLLRNGNPQLSNQDVVKES